MWYDFRNAVEVDFLELSPSRFGHLETHLSTENTDHIEKDEVGSFAKGLIPTSSGAGANSVYHNRGNLFGALLIRVSDAVA